MRTYLMIAAAFTLLSARAFGQPSTMPITLELPVEIREAYKSDPIGSNKYRLSFQWNSDELLNEATLRQVRREGVCRIDMVFPRYSGTADSNMKALNELRLRALGSRAAFLFYNTAIEWRLIAVQMKTAYLADTSDVQPPPFTGFVIYTRPHYIWKDQQFVINEKPVSATQEALYLYNDLKQYTCYLEGAKKMRLKKKKEEAENTGYFIPKADHKEARGILYETRSVWNRDEKWKQNEYEDTLWRHAFVMDTTCACLAEKNVVLKKIAITERDKTTRTDTTVTAVMNRNQQWKQVMMVTDVTAGMSPYVLDMLQWRKLIDRGKRARQYVYFNDGDHLPDIAPGNAGGTYYVEGSDSRPIELVCFQAMQNGSGGEAPENNVEALIFAQKKNEAKAEVVMVADNWAPVRDLSFVGKLKNPVHIIVCGGDGERINADYLWIAYKTGGSVHTPKHDVTGLGDLSVGNTIDVGNITYRLSNFGFQIVKK